jgi:PQQ-dependent dehydrogenase (methanol/ethanol family)
MYGLGALAAAGALALAACGQEQETADAGANAPAPAPAAETPAQAADAAPASGSATFAQVDGARLTNAAAEPGQWLTHGGTYWEQRYSQLDEITTENVGELGLAWYGDYDTNINQQGTPLYIDGVIYVSTARSKVYAFDARTGEELWFYDPLFDPAVAQHVCCGLVNRGVAAWEGKIYIGTLDGRLIALNAETGEEIFDRQVADREASESITLALRAVDGKILLGVAGGEYKVRGWMGAFDANTGEEVWRFYTVPGNPADGFENAAMEMAAETWITPGWWEAGGGGPVWDSLIFDPVTRLVYFGTGNGTPWNAEHRDSGGGDNLFLASIVAVNIDDGAYAWHYQQNPWETWDYDATAPIMVANLEISGQERHVIMQAPKNGFLYVLDAATGELLEANPFANMNWATGIGEDGRPIEVPGARYDVTDEAWNMLPGPAGAHGWAPMAYSQQTGLVYVPTQDMYMVLEQSPTFEKSDTGFNLGIQFPASPEYYEQNPDAPRGFTGYLRAINPVTGEIVWQSDDNTATGGALATAGGLVFQGGGGGQTVRAFNAATGERLWEQDVHTSATAGPISYELDGKQYVAFSVGGTAPGGDYFAPANARLLVYTLGGTATLPEPAAYTQRPLSPPAQTASLEAVEAGRELYGANCAVCHGPDATGGRAALPNLTRTPLLHAQAGFEVIVLDGRPEQGMPAFAGTLDAEDAGQIMAFVTSTAHELVARQAAGPGGPGGPGGGGGGGGNADADADADAEAAEEPEGDGIHENPDE